MERNRKTIEQSKRILELRIKKGLTQEELSKLTNISVPYISRIEKGHVNITMKTFIAMSKALDCSIEFLENGYNESEPSFSQDTSSTTKDISRTRKSSNQMKEKDFAKYRRDTRDALDDIIYNCDVDMIKSLKTIMQKISDYSFTRNSLENIDRENQVLLYDRCLKYIDDIDDELRYLIAHYEIEE